MKKFTKLFLVLVLGLAIVLPMQVSNVNAISNGSQQRAKLQHYTFNEYKYEYGIYQYRINELCPTPAVFQWYDNGIPEDVLYRSLDGCVFFDESRIIDTGYGIVDTGVYFRKFGAKMNDGRTVYFWAHANDLNDLIY